MLRRRPILPGLRKSAEFCPKGLRSANKSLFAMIDEAVYESEAAFNRAFKRHFGLPPATWRKNATSPPVDTESSKPALLLIDADSGPQGSPR